MIAAALEMPMKRIGVYVVAIWCFLRALGGAVGSVRLRMLAGAGDSPWSLTLVVFILECGLWALAGALLLTRRRLGVLLCSICCIVVVAWSTYGFFKMPGHSWSRGNLGLYLGTLIVHSSIAVYLFIQRRSLDVRD